MPALDEIRARFSGDRFATEAAGTVIDAAEPGYARCSMPVRPIHLNANSVPMGGAVFTLADFAFAVAANGHSARLTVTQQVSVTFLAACLYAVDVTDDLGAPVAHLTINGFTSDPRP